MEPNTILEVGGRRWKVREAISEQAAMSAIAFARISGSVGSRHSTTSYPNGIDQPSVTVTQADVVQINSDGTERQPYTEPY